MSTPLLRWRRLALAVTVAPTLVLTVLAGQASSLPDAAAPQGEEHAHTHGPDGLELDVRGRGPAAGVPAATYAVDAPAPWNAADYDGLAPTTDQADLTELHSFHAVYVYPADRASRFGQFAAMFQADARDASALLTTLYGRGIRFDERAGAGGPYLDITVVKSRYKYRQLSGSNQFSLVADELAARGLKDPDKKYVAWLDAGSRYCGQGHLYGDERRQADNNNNLRTTAIVYRPYAAGGESGGFCRGRTLRHELGHNLGALQARAPNAFDGAHCDDSPEDTMCYTSATSGVDTGDAAFDHGNDDYWDPVAAGRSGKLAWWTVNLSKFVCPTSGCDQANTPEY